MTNLPEGVEPLGFCTSCTRVRWLATYSEVGGSLQGTCTQCAREAREAAAPKRTTYHVRTGMDDAVDAWMVRYMDGLDGTGMTPFLMEALASLSGRDAVFVSRVTAYAAKWMEDA